MANQKNRKHKLIYFLKIIISISLLIYLLSKVEWEKSLSTIQNANIMWIAIAVLLSIFDNLLLTYKWNLLLKIRGKIVSFWKLFSINMIGGFWGLFLPSSLSTDVVRGYYLIKTSSDSAISITSIFVDRILALLGLIVFVTIAFFFSGSIFNGIYLEYYIIGFYFTFFFGILVFISDYSSNILTRIDNRLGGSKIIEKIIMLRLALIEYKNYPLTLTYSFFLGLVVQLFRVYWYITIAWAFNVDIPLIYFFIFCPLIIFILLIPVSIGGLGVREGTFVALFTLAGMSLDDAVIISFTSSLIANLIVSSGGIFYLIQEYDLKQNGVNSKYNLKAKT